MSENSKIQWCDHTFNPWIGCTKLTGGRVEGTLVREDEACFHCYAAETDRRRFSRTLGGGTKAKPVSHWGHGAPRHVTQTWDEPRRWERQAAEGLAAGAGAKRPRVFCGSLCDWADCEVADELRTRLFDLIDACPGLDWMLLSKREQKAVEFLTARYGVAASPGHGKESRAVVRLPDHIWLGFSAGRQESCDIRLAAMARVEARVKFLSCEPLFENIWLGDQAKRAGLNLVIYGGESGPMARAQDVDCIRHGVGQCRGLGIAAFVKQLGSKPEVGSVPLVLRDGKGGDMGEWRADLRVRELPGRTV